ncbi:unnamed protein product [Caenorhabditis brenneri]
MSVPPTPKRIKMEEEKMDFEDPDEQRHDCVLVVKEKKFYCVKATLAKHASFFDKLFFAKNANKKTKEYKLVDPETPEGFQAFLEVIHGVKSLKDENIKEVLSLASLWTAGVAKNRCLEFLSSDQCQMDLKAKFQMACELKLVEYLEFLLDGIHDAQTINPLITEEVMILDQPLIGVVFKKFFELCRNPDVIVERMRGPEPERASPGPWRVPEHLRGPDDLELVRVLPPARAPQPVWHPAPPRFGGGIRREPPPFLRDESPDSDDQDRPRRPPNRAPNRERDPARPLPRRRY